MVRRATRLKVEKKKVAAKNKVLPVLICGLQRITQRSVKFVRWLRVQLFTKPQHQPNIAALLSYAIL